MDFGSASSLFRMLFLPPAGMFLVLLGGWGMRRRWPVAGKFLIRFSLLIFFILCTPAGADLMVAPLENMTKPLRYVAEAKSQAIVILAAGRVGNAPEYDGAGIPDYIALARLRYGARLQHQTGLPLLVSGGNRARLPPFESKAADMATALRSDFLTPVTWVEENSETTAENATLSAAMLRVAGITRVLLVTDAMHMARAERVFSRAGLQVVAAPTMFFRLDYHDLGTFIPSAEGLRLSYYAAYEWIGIAWYRLRVALA